jgi:hypothetical protein
VVRGNHIPRRVLRTRRAQRVLEGRDIVVPEFAFGIVGFTDFPVAGRIIGRMVEISMSGSGEGPGGATRPGYSTTLVAVSLALNSLSRYRLRSNTK